jgi:glycosyltransferase involved in cell wall biosynthesis
MKVLQLCHKPPFPPTDGGCIAMHNITKGLIDAGHQVKIITAFTHKHDLQLDALPEWYLENTSIEGIFVETRVNLIDAFSSLVTQDSYNVSRFFNADLDIRLEALLRREKFDVIHIESLFMTPYLATLRRHSKALLVLRSHNLEYIIWERIADGTRNLAKRSYLKYLSKKLKAYELDVMEAIDGIAAISGRDRKRYEDLGCTKPIITIPFGINADDYGFSPALDAPLTLFHIGAMDWRPNHEAMLWLLDDIIPLVLRDAPEAQLHLAGRELTESLFTQLPSCVTLHGEVDDAIKFMHTHSIMIVPLLSAGGIRVKIIEAMACGKAIITTSIGAEGIDGVHNEHFVIANDAESMADAIVRLLHSPTEVARLGQNARALACEHFDNRKIIASLTGFYTTLKGSA